MPMDSLGLPDTLAYPPLVDYKLPDTTQTIASSFQCSDKVITVANYANRVSYIDVLGHIIPTTNTSVTFDNVHPGSSTGPTRDGRLKPDIAATGHFTVTPASLGQIVNWMVSRPTRVALGGMHGVLSGSSASSPVVYHSCLLAILFTERHYT